MAAMRFTGEGAFTASSLSQTGTTQCWQWWQQADYSYAGYAVDAQAG